ncbi:GEVED domain-containing protein [Actibacterium ureilyticum]|uniref:GEVED domain-containing protein n=1 Tax=Actibacterium ureilyticum TaxID=1590614 RepID=UPI001FE85494|nr:GEVED domain-containing protein [Actibacterium ureilyticum]
MKALFVPNRPPQPRASKRSALAGSVVAFGVLAGAPALAEVCSVSPDYVNWVTPGTIGGLDVDQSATLQWGSAATDIAISGPFFIWGTETSIIRISEYPESRGTYSVNFASPVIHDLNVFIGNAGRNGFDPLQSAVVGDFNMALSGGGSANNLFGSVSPLDNQGYFQIFSSDTEGIAPTTLTGTGGDGLPLDGRFWVHDANLVPGDINNGGQDQAYGMIDLAYTPPAVISGSSDSITQLTMRQVGVGVGPTVALGIQARLKSCINATDNDFTAAPIDSSAGGTTLSVLTDDVLNGGSVDTALLTGNVDLALVSAPAPAAGSITLDTATGEIDVAPGTTPGTYFVEYSLTDRPTGGVTPNTDTATATVVVAAEAAPPASPLTCTPQSVFARPRTQIAGSGSASALTLSDIFVFDDVTSDIDGKPIDAVFQLDSISNAINLELSTGLLARMTPADNGYVTYRLRLVQDGTATAANPQGTAIDQSRFNGIIVQQTDVDSNGTTDDSSDVVGPVDPATRITHFNTAPLAGFPAPGTPIAMDPAKVGDPTNWFDEPNETDFDNFATYDFDTFVEARFIHGYTGTSTNAGTRGSGILLCAISDTSTVVVARDDDYTATPINTLFGGSTGEVLANDTINGIPAAFPGVTIDVLTEAEPQNLGDPVPVLQTSGADIGRVVVPAGTPAGVYTIDYRLCDSVDPTDCDRARVTVAVFDGDGVDFGDAPVTYLTPTHGIPTTPTVYLGAIAPDAELVAQSDAAATADDTTGVDDEDAVSFPVLTQGMISTVNVDVTGSGYLQGWIDFNGDGVFETGLGEQVATDLRDDGTVYDNVAGDGVIQIDVAVPTDATTSTTYARFRYSNEAGLSTSSFAVDGEVEDYSLIIAAADLVDRGDAPASYGDPRHAVVPEIYLGAGLPDTETVPQNSLNADADDLAGIDDEDGIASFPVLVAGTTVPLTVATHETLSLQLDLGLPVSSGITNLQLWIDFDQNGSFDADEQIATDYRDGGTGDTDGSFNNQIILDIPVPADIGNGTSYARVRWSTSSGVTADPFDGFNLDGEVEDYLVTLSNPNGPLVCSDTFYMVATETAQNLPALSELLITESGGTYTLSQNLLPPDYTGNYLVTGWGYNELDGYIYGVRQSPRSLMRINASGAVQEVADLSALTLESPDTSSDILPNGIMLYMSGSNFGRYQLLDISDPANPVALGVLDAGAGAPYGRDIAYNPRDGLMYFIDSNRDIYAFDPLNGTPGTTTVNLVGNVPLPAGIFSMDPDSVWFDGSGFLYAFDNQSRQVFAVEIGAAGNYPASFAFIEVEGTVANLTYQGNDGASCRAPGPFASTLFAEGSITGTLYQDANGSGAFDTGETVLPAGIAVALHDDNGTPADPADDTLMATVDTLADGTYRFDSVNATLTYRIEVDAADPEIPAGLAPSTANPLTGVTVTTGATTAGQDFGFAAAPASADLALTKTVLDAASGQPTTEAIAGAELDFVLTVTNDGPGSPSGVTVRDLIPDGYAYVSDDAAAQGDSYDTGTGIWTLGDVPTGSSHSLTIRVAMRESGEHTNVAEITASSLADPDSDPATGPLVDDLGDGVADDDEASASVALSGLGATLSGTVFIDNGAGATAFDGLQAGAEVGTDRATLQVFDSTGTLIDTPPLAADGSWSLTLPAGYADAVTLTLLPDPGLYPVSETAAALPGLVNPDPRDGSLTFTPVAGDSYAGLDMGVIEGARLNEDQQSAIRPGQVVSLRHEYLADAPGNVTFSVDLQDSNAADGFSTGLFLDETCDGNADQPITAPLPTQAGTLICVIARVSASSGVGQGTYYSFDVLAQTAYPDIGLTEEHRNRDRLTVESAQGALSLSKTVRNVTQGTPEGVSNGAAAGDVLEYRIYLENTGTLPASEIHIYDRTPPYTVLAGPIPSPVTIEPGVTCDLAVPATNAAGYAGDLRWDCSGFYSPGGNGSVSFQVRVAP